MGPVSLDIIIITTIVIVIQIRRNRRRRRINIISHGARGLPAVISANSATVLLIRKWENALAVRLNLNEARCSYRICSTEKLWNQQRFYVLWEFVGNYIDVLIYST